MDDTNLKAEAFFSAAEEWREEVRSLRAILLDSPLAEDFKWRSPCYTLQGRNVAAIWSLRDYCALAFFKGVLFRDPENILVAPGSNSRSMRLIKFTTVPEIDQSKDLLRDYINRGIEVEKSDLKVDFKKDDLPLPEELVRKLEDDRSLKVALNALTPGRQRGYILHFTQPKQSKTRISRIEKCVPRIMAGKGMHDR